MAVTLGRPLKGGSRRTPITIHAPYKIIEIIDDYVAACAEKTGIAYSRSDFYNDAAIAMLDALGIDVPEGDRRTKNVPADLSPEDSGDNVDNTDKTEPEKTAGNTGR